jgi:hypothetical protein
LSSGGIFSCPKAGCAAQPTLLASGLDNPSFISTDGTNVYWAETGLIRKCAVAGCNNSPTTIATTVTDAAGIAIDERMVYWAEVGSLTGAAQGLIRMASK